jgi:hypothetical protein
MKHEEEVGYREAVLQTCLITFLLVSVGTELLSLFTLLRRGPLVLLWGAALLFALHRLHTIYGRKTLRSRVKRFGSGIWEEPLELLCAAAIATSLGLTFVCAVLAPPNNWDSMTYHMARVAAWVQNESVRFFPTAIARQNYQPPLAEFAILHLQLLSGSDRLSNLVQWSCFVASILSAWLIAAELGGNRISQWLSATFVATLPMGILQASSTQNDLVEGLFVVAFALYLLRVRRDSRPKNLALCGISFGMALQTKGTGYIFCVSLLVALGSAYLFADAGAGQRCKRLGRLAILAAIALALNAGHYARSWDAYGTPISTEPEVYTNDRLTVGLLTANVFRNIALHLGTPSQRADEYVTMGIRSALGDNLNPPGSNMGEIEFERVAFSRHEDTAGNFVHLLLATIACLMLFGIRQGERQGLAAYAWGVLGAAILYCVILRWQPWGSRLHTSLFLLMAPLVGITLCQVCSRRKVWLVFTVALLFGYGLQFMLANVSRPILPLLGESILATPRIKQYFTNRRDLYTQTVEAVLAIQREHPEEVGLVFGAEGWEYPFWVLLGKTGKRVAPLIKHIHLDGNSIPSSMPAAIVIEKPLDIQTVAPLLSSGYRVIFDSKDYSVLSRSPIGHSAPRSSNGDQPKPGALPLSSS